MRSSTVSSVACLIVASLGSVPYLVRQIPGTPLRVMGVALIDYRCRRSGIELTRRGRDQIASFLAFHAALNAAFDRKCRFYPVVCEARRASRRANLDQAFCRRYARRLYDIECRIRRNAASTPRRCAARKARRYRESTLVHLYEGMCWVAKLPRGGSEATVALLCLIQLVDDTIDHELDRVRRTPTFTVWDCGRPVAERRLRYIHRALTQRYSRRARAVDDPGEKVIVAVVTGICSRTLSVLRVRLGR
jgi:hypothetical protein